MTEIIVPLPDDLRDQAELAARQNGITLDHFVRQCIAMNLFERAQDPIFANLSVFRGEAPSDLAERHDDYLYGENS